MRRWKHDIKKEETKKRPRLLNQRRIFNEVLLGGGRVSKKVLLDKNVNIPCKDGDPSYCLVTANGNTYYIPIRQTKNDDGSTTCTMYLRNHPPIDMTNKCGKDVTRDMDFHSSKQQKEWNRPCEYQYDQIVAPHKACLLKKKENSCTVM